MDVAIAEGRIPFSVFVIGRRHDVVEMQHAVVADFLVDPAGISMQRIGSSLA